MSPDQAVKEARRLYQEYLDAVSVEAPQLRETRMRKFHPLGLALRSLILRAFLRCLHVWRFRQPPKYVFQGLRHRQLIRVLPAAEVMVLGGRGELATCLRMGYRFLWIGFVSKAFELFFWGGREKVFRDAVVGIRNIFALGPEERTCLFLWEDTLPTGLTLSLALSCVSNLSVACIQHGYYGPERMQRRNEGSNCRFNLLIDQAQARYIKGEGDPGSFVLGLPYEVVQPQRHARRVILVGNGGQRSDISRYFLSLSHFTRIHSILRRAGVEVAYRPHPDEDRKFVGRLFPSISIVDRLDLLCEARMVYVGFNSTLLYEALGFGNAVIGLETSEFSGDRAFAVDSVVSPSEYDRVCEHVERLFAKISGAKVSSCESLADRFLRCVARIDDTTFESVHAAPCNS